MISIQIPSLYLPYYLVKEQEFISCSFTIFYNKSLGLFHFIFLEKTTDWIMKNM